MPKALYLLLVSLLGGGLWAQSSSIQPNTGSQGQTLPIIISGQNTQYQSGSATVQLQYSQGSFTINQGSITGFTNIQVNGPTQIGGTLLVPSNAPFGSYHLLVMAGSNTMTFDQSAFTVQAPASNSIQIVPNGVKPGNTLNGMTITVPAASFKNAMTGINDVWLSKGSITLDDFNNINVQNASSFTADFTAPSNAPQGMYDINVYENSGAMHVSVNAFEISNTISLIETPLFNFSYFPNPAQDYLRIAYANANPEMSFEILDLNGRLIQSFAAEGAEGAMEFTIGDLARGMYLLSVKQGDNVLTVKKWQKR